MLIKKITVNKILRQFTTTSERRKLISFKITDNINVRMNILQLNLLSGLYILNNRSKYFSSFGKGSLTHNEISCAKLSNIMVTIHLLWWLVIFMDYQYKYFYLAR